VLFVVFLDFLASSIAADGLDGALLEGGRAGGLLGGISGLVIDVTTASRLVALEIQRCCLAAKVAVDAGEVDVEWTANVFGHLVNTICHGVRASGESGPSTEKGTAPAGAERVPLI
jgi:hypothetical protein